MKVTRAAIYHKPGMIMRKLVASVTACAVLLSLATAPARAQGGPVKDVFEKYGLIGSFAQDCSKEPSRDNLYFTNRVMPSGEVQRDQMSGHMTRDHMTIFDKAQALGPIEISLSGVLDGLRIDSVWRVDKNRQLTWELTRGDLKVVTNGRYSQGGEEVQWLTKCLPRAAPAQSSPGGSVKLVFEKYGLLGTFAWDCNKPASEDSNWYFVHRAINADRVQRDYMIGATTRKSVVLIDEATPLGPDELSVSGTLDGRRSNGIWRMQGNRMLQWELELDGNKIITAGKFASSGRDVPWLNKCGVAGTRR